ncbi:hypothetical protein D3C71_1873140 [compost metagenome]
MSRSLGLREDREAGRELAIKIASLFILSHIECGDLVVSGWAPCKLPYNGALAGQCWIGVDVVEYF